MTSLSVCIPTYNRPVELGNLLDSIPRSVPVNVSDNGGFLTEDFRRRFTNVRFKVAGDPAVPIFANWNSAARMGDTEWLLVPSDDDIYFPDSFDQMSAAIAANTQADVVVFGHHIVGETYEVLDTWQPEARRTCAPDGFEAVKFGVDARMPSIAIRRSAMVKLGYFDEHYALTASDSDLVQRALLSFDTAFVPTIVSGYRVWQGGLTHRSLATPEWLGEIDYWGTKIAAMMKQIAKYADQAATVRDELYARNLLEGLRLLRRQGRAQECCEHFRRSRYPSKALASTRLRIWAQVLGTYWR